MKCWDNYETAGPSQSASQSHLGPISLTRLALDAANLLPLCKRVLAPRAFIQNCHQNLQMNGTQNCKFLTRALLRFDLLHNLVLDTTSFGINNILGFREPETHWGECVLKWGLQLRRGSRSVLGPRNKCNLNWKKNSDNVSGGLFGSPPPLLSIFTVWPSTEICPNISELYFDCKQKIFCYQFSPTSV